MSKKTNRRKTPPQPDGNQTPGDTLPPASNPLEGTGAEAPVETTPEATVEAPLEAPEAAPAEAVVEAPKPAWKSRVSTSAAERSQLFDVKPGSWLARRCKSPVRRSDLERKGHSVERLVRIGTLTLVNQETDQ